MRKKSYNICEANEHPITFPEKVDDTLNGRNSRQVDFVDVGCGFGGLTSKNIQDIEMGFLMWYSCSCYSFS